MSPNSPYSASEPWSNHLVRAWHHTFGLPVIMTNCSNNYGPYQHPEKLIPLMIASALRQPAPAGLWKRRQYPGLVVRRRPRARAVARLVAWPGRRESDIGGNAEMTNLDLVHLICGILDEYRPAAPHCPHAS